MKKIVATAMLITASTFASAGLDCRSGVDHKHPACYGMYKVQHRHHGHPVIVQRDNDWVGPAIVTIIGSAVVADVISRNRKETVIVQQPAVVQQTQTCSAWTETQNPDGTITRSRTCSQ